MPAMSTCPSVRVARHLDLSDLTAVVVLYVHFSVLNVSSIALTSSRFQYLSFPICAPPVPHLAGSCDPANKTAIYEMITNNNRIYAPNADVVVTCGSKLTFAQWQATGLDVGTTVQETPDAATIIGWAAQLLGISTDI